MKMHHELLNGLIKYFKSKSENSNNLIWWIWLHLVNTQSIWDLHSSNKSMPKIVSDQLCCNILIVNRLSICLSPWWNDENASGHNRPSIYSWEDMLLNACYNAEDICHFATKIDERETKPRSAFACKTIDSAILPAPIENSRANLLWRHCPADSMPPLPLPRWLSWYWFCTMYPEDETPQFMVTVYVSFYHSWLPISFESQPSDAFMPTSTEDLSQYPTHDFFLLFDDLNAHSS